MFSAQVMGRSRSSQKTPLGCFLRHFKEGFVEGAAYGIKFSPGTLRTLCEVEWPSFGVNWPLEGSFDWGSVRNVWKIVTGDPGHPVQFPYIDQVKPCSEPSLLGSTSVPFL